MLDNPLPGSETPGIEFLTTSPGSYLYPAAGEEDLHFIYGKYE